MNLKTHCLQGKAIFPYIKDIAQLRITIFKEYPYLYEGNYEYEMNYLQSYINSLESTFILILDGDKVIGASTAIPLKDAAIEFQKPFLEKNIELHRVFYFGESVLKPAYRSQGIYKIFFKEREHAGRKGKYDIFAFCAVERPINHPLKPKSYKDLNLVWEHFGYKKHPEIVAYLPWKEINETEESNKPLIFWLKYDDKNCNMPI